MGAGGGGGRAHYHYPVGLTDCDDKYGGRTEHLTDLVPEPRYIRTDVRRGVCRDVTMLISAGRRAGSFSKVLRHYRAGGRCVGAMSVDRSVWCSYPQDQPADNTVFSSQQ